MSGDPTKKEDWCTVAMTAGCKWLLVRPTLRIYCRSRIDWFPLLLSAHPCPTGIMGDACTPLYNEKYHTLPPVSFVPLASSPFLHPVGWRDGREVGVVVLVVVVVVKMFFWLRHRSRKGGSG